jgi:hypothetical protein
MRTFPTALAASLLFACSADRELLMPSADAVTDATADAADAPVEVAGDSASIDACGSCLDAVLRWGLSGGQVVSHDEMHVGPCADYGRARFLISDSAHPVVQCSMPLPRCAAPGEVALSLYDVTSALEAPDVAAAFRLGYVRYGVDTQDQGGQVLQIRLRYGLIELSGDCPADDAGSCTPPPAGVKALVARLHALDAQALAGACIELR